MNYDNLWHVESTNLKIDLILSIARINKVLLFMKYVVLVHVNLLYTIINIQYYTTTVDTRRFKMPIKAHITPARRFEGVLVKH